MKECFLPLPVYTSCLSPGLEAPSNATLMDGAKTFGFHLPLFSEIFNLRKKLQARRQEESARLGSPQPASDLQVGALLQEPSGTYPPPQARFLAPNVDPRRPFRPPAPRESSEARLRARRGNPPLSRVLLRLLGDPAVVPGPGDAETPSRLV